MLDNPFETANPFETGTPAPSFNPAQQQQTDAPFGGTPSFSPPPAPFPQNNKGGGNQYGSNNFGNNNGGGFGNNNNNGKRRYKFVQMYLLINPKLFAKQQLEGESPLLDISYNVDYGNLRLTFCNINQNTFDSTSIKVQNVERTTVVNLYPEVAEQLLYNLENWKPNQIQAFERMIQSNANWSPNATYFTIDPTNQTVSVNSKPANSNNISKYVFSEWQLNALINSLKFLVNGTAWNLDLAKFLAVE
jgi:hypothetical protein